MPTYTTRLQFVGDSAEDAVTHEVEIDIEVISDDPLKFEVDEIRLIVARLHRVNFEEQTLTEIPVVITLDQVQFNFLSPVCERILEAAAVWAVKSMENFNALQSS